MEKVDNRAIKLSAKEDPDFQYRIDEQVFTKFLERQKTRSADFRPSAPPPAPRRQAPKPN